ncbi:MAG: acylphosphatase, partial [Clostridiales bacterium]|nr:acylphosphatase [Clostridiales bacterium]
MNVVRKHIIFSGRVQGVGFRYTACYLASSLGLTGWVNNLWDGDVEMEVQGDEASISRLVERLH